MLNQDMLALGTARSSIRELFEYGKKLSQRIGAENVFDFSLGNPSIPAPEEVNTTLKKLIDETPSTLLHGYTSADGDASVRRAVADFISNQFSAEAFPENIYMTVGAAAALTCTLKALTCEGDEVLILAPYFPEYRVFIEAVGAEVKVSLCHPESFRPNIQDIEEKISEKCAAVIINSPNNPSGAVYTEEDIKAIAEVLCKKSRDYGHSIYIISDEPYREITYDGVKLPFIPNYYKDTVVCYSFSKSLSIPGERIGYAFVSPKAKDSELVSAAIAGAGRAMGYVCAPSLLQRLVASCLGKTADISAYLENRNILTKALREFGYTVPEGHGAFYLFVKSPIPDAKEFSDIAKERGLLLVPGDDFGYPGFLRIAYCQSKDRIIRSLPLFKELINGINH